MTQYWRYYESLFFSIAFGNIKLRSFIINYIDREKDNQAEVFLSQTVCYDEFNIRYLSCINNHLSQLLIIKWRGNMTRMITLLAAIVLFVTATIIAHPPSGMELSYDNETKILEVLVKHNVGNPRNHFIGEVTIINDDKQMILHQLTKQEDANSIMFQYRLPNAEQGMVLQVTAKCNRVGSISKEIDID